MTFHMLFASVTQLAAALRAGDVSAAEVLEAHLGQIAAHSPALNAIVTLDAERAQARARAADAARARGQLLGPLHGVPFTLKDAFATAGMRTTTGTPMLDRVPVEESTVSARLTQAGGILMGKTNVAEMLGDPAQTSNPWNTARTPGGSSGGADRPAPGA